MANPFTREGYNFCGWAKTSTGSVAYSDQTVVFNVTSPGKIVNLFAVWKANTFTVRYDANGGTGRMADGKATYGVQYALSTCTFVSSGSDFAGWTAKVASTGKLAYSADGGASSDIGFYAEGSQPEGWGLYVFSDGQTIKKLGVPNGDILILSAQWQGIAVTPEGGDEGEDAEEGEDAGEETVEKTGVGLQINGTPIEEFVVVTPAGKTYDTAAGNVVSAIKSFSGVTLSTAKSTVSTQANEIVIGNTGRDADESTYGYDDGKVYYKNGRLYLGCGSKWTADMVVNFVKTQLLVGNVEQNILLPTDGTPVYSVSMPDRDEYIEDPSLMPVHWEFKWKPEPWMLDFDDKIAALNCTDKAHLFTVSHRADFLYYPENSIESIISVWQMGGDCVEIDVQFTKDGVPVLLHDSTLTRMTNYSAMKGKNGLPSSNKVSKWTYAQLCKLNLKEGQGGDSASVTPYKIATLEEALRVCKDRLFIILDKQETWRYCDLDGVQPDSDAKYILPYMIKTGNITSILISYGTIDTTADGTLDADEAVKIQKYIYKKTGQKMYMFLRGWTTRGTAEPYAATLEEDSLTNSGIIVNGAYDPAKASTLKSLCKKYPQTLFCGWTLETSMDKKSYWADMYSIGLRAIMSNNIFTLVQYAAELK